MNDRRPWTVDELFDAAMQQPPESREAFVRAQSGDDEKLADEALSLIDAHDRAGGFLGRSAIEEDPTLAGLADPNLGRTIGPYCIARLIAIGGMGRVYLAERSDGAFTRNVAVKIIRQDIGTDEIIRRFNHERAVLAQLDHPNIGRLLDGGSTDEGVPYLVMEFVEGQSITEYCDAKRLDIRARLELFRTVCEAVQFAHQNLVIHRDLKPSNILVTAGGTVKLLDFGIAKVLSSGEREHVDLTVTRERRLTPAYASPEQVRGGTVTTATDVFSLGVVLYELLTGHRPHATKSGSAAEIERAICDEPPTRPSVIVQRATITDGGDDSTANTRSPQQISAERDIDPARLRRLLAGDLETIVLMALRKEPQRRYAPAQQLSEDIGRFLRREPIIARSPSVTYQCRRFVQRNALLTGAAAGIALALIAAVLGTSAGMVQAKQAAAEAQRQTRIAEAINTFLNEDLLASIDPELSQQHDVSMRAVLDQASAGIEDRFHEEPIVGASIRMTLGRTYRSLGDYDAAEPHLEWAMNVCLDQFGEHHPETLRAKDQLAALYTMQGRFSEAEQMHRDVLEVSRRVNGNEHRDTLRFMDNLASSLVSQGSYGEAESLRLTVLEIARRTQGERHRDTIAAMMNLGHLYLVQRQSENAERLLEQSIELARETFGPRHPTTQRAMSNLAYTYDQRRKYELSEPLHLEVLETMRNVLGEEHPGTFITMNNLALLYNATGRHDDAEPLFIEVLNANRRMLGAEHPNTLAAINNLGFLYLQWGKMEQALPLLEEVVPLLRRVQGDEYRLTTGAMNNLATVYLTLERYEQAGPLLADLVAAVVRTAPPGHPAIGIVRGQYGRCLAMLGRHDEAEHALLAALDVLSSALGETHQRTVAVLHSLDLLYGEAHMNDPARRSAIRDRMSEEISPPTIADSP